MECPHCLTKISTNVNQTRLLPILSDQPGKNCRVYSVICPECDERIIYSKFIDTPGFGVLPLLSTKEFEKIKDTLLLFPKMKKPPHFSSDVLSKYVREYEEAYAVLDISAKASAALSRRLLQQLLWDRGIKKRDLAEEIKEAINTSQFPSETAKFINNVRYLGNFAAHPLKTAAGQIVKVKPEEARWCLCVLALLFDHYFIQPAKAKRIQKAVYKKSSRPKKPVIKASSSQPSSSP